MVLNTDQENDFMQLKLDMDRALLTEPALTDEQIFQYRKKNIDNKDEDYYFFLKRQLPSAKAAALYLDSLKRRTKDRVKEAERAEQHTKPTSNIKNKLGLSQSSSKDDIIKALQRLKNKSDATWRALGLNKKETLKKYNI